MNNLEDIKGIGPKTIINLKRNNINSLIDLIEFYPYKYNVIKKSDINLLKDNDPIIIDGYIESIPRVFYFKGKMNRMLFRIISDTNILDIIIYNRAFLKPQLVIGTNVILMGKFEKRKNVIIASELRFGSLGKEEVIEPVYHSVQGISQNQLIGYISEAINYVRPVNYIPSKYQEKYNYIDKNQIIKNIHRPSNEDDLKKYQEQLKYEELFLFMLQMNYLKLNKNKRKGISRAVDYNKVKNFIDDLPFSLTFDQKTAVDVIYDDLISNNKMNRLLQGDVGSGKTIVSIIAMYINYLGGYMSALMAPTEVLAKQHYENIKKLFKDADLKIVLLTGKMKKRDRDNIVNKLNNGEADIVVGTHALITEDLNYNNLGLVITDEQHRFGVNQRTAFKDKGILADILYMSATPIPRTYALTLYGDMDVSSIKTMPSGRKEVKTYLKTTKQLKEVLESMLSELKKGHQIYVVVPLIEESENSDMESVDEVYNNMERAFGKLFKIGKLHGKLKTEEKDAVLEEFKENKIQILVSTTVIEVGIDVKNATMIVIYDSYRFGLSTLHQLRGRVGRNDLESTCILLSDKETKRLEILTETNDGFLISEEDFKLRGSGDLFGIKQSGDMTFKVANIKNDYNLLLKAKDDSEEFLKSNLDLVNINNPYLKKLLIHVSDLD